MSGGGPRVISTPPDKCSKALGSDQRERLRPENPWAPWNASHVAKARRWLADSYALHTPRKSTTGAMAGPGAARRLRAILDCGSGETMTTVDGELVCAVDEDGNPSTPRRREVRCGHRLCPTCASKWAGRNVAAISERIEALHDPVRRAALVDAALAEASDGASMETEALAMPPSRRRGSMLRSARLAQSRGATRAACLELFPTARLRILTLTQRATPTAPPPEGETPGQRAERLAGALAVDMDRMHERLRKLTTSPQWRRSVFGWVLKIEQTFTTPTKRNARLANGGRISGGVETENWHVHAHALVWTTETKQQTLRGMWEATRAPGEEEGGAGSLWIEAPRGRGVVGAVAEVLKYAAKPIDLAGHDVSVGAAWISIMAGRRLVRVGGAFDGLALVEEGEAEVEEVEATAKAYATPTGRIIDSTTRTVWQSGPWWEEHVRAWRAEAWERWRRRRQHPEAENGRDVKQGET